VYDQTGWGRELEPIVLARGEWGVQVPQPEAPITLSATSVLIYLQTAARVDPDAAPASYRFEIGDRVWTVRTQAGRVQVEAGEPTEPVDAAIHTDPKGLNALLQRQALPEGSHAELSGDRRALHRLLRAVGPTSK
jgi:hypothetical protein